MSPATGRPGASSPAAVRPPVAEAHAVDPPMLPAPEQMARRRERKRALQKRGIALATAGLLLALAMVFALRLLGLADFPVRAWLAALALTLVVQSVLWCIPHRRLATAASWDPHFVYLPVLAAALLLGLYIFIAPEARVLILMGWFVTLLFMAGLTGLTEVVLLSGFMAAVYLAAVSLRAAEGFPVAVGFEVAVAAVFFGICCYAGFVFRRLREERLKMQALRRDLAELATRDPLTGLPNRRHFEELLREELLRTQRYGDECSVAMIDVDHFKVYNDGRGHLAGDEVLRQLAALLQSNLRETDIAARYGGEEFALILVQTGLDRAAEVVERMRSIVEAHEFDGEEILPGRHLTISVGLAECGPARVSYEESIRRADDALYRAKHDGRNCVRIADRAR